ncbi:hypothetical protein [Alicyclobacillus acidiphilus]|uniref:hypothetical protein n=1 Tax=Alicyclobacillus acidiphilus TaxID=182455 RepID=UPI002893244E|nr:hypothetical protein [Alicyclobacillus acidiphilus]
MTLVIGEEVRDGRTSRGNGHDCRDAGRLLGMSVGGRWLASARSRASGRQGGTEARDATEDDRNGGRQERRTAGTQEGRKAGRQEGRKAGRQEGRKAGRQDGNKRPLAA